MKDDTKFIIFEIIKCVAAAAVSAYLTILGYGKPLMVISLVVLVIYVLKQLYNERPGQRLKDNIKLVNKIRESARRLNYREIEALADQLKNTRSKILTGDE